jgi:Ca2+-binding RTX toxin-like protein
MRRSRVHRAGRAAALVAPMLLLALLPAVAEAGDVSVQGGTLRYMGGSPANDVTVSLQGTDRFQVVDSRAAVTAGAGCTSTGQRRATCPTAGVTGLSIDVGGGADRVTIATEVATPALIEGGGGNDTLRGGAGSDRVNGGPDADILDGRAGNDTESGGDGDDTFDQGAAPNGADALSGGGGVDRAGFGARSAGLEISLDDTADDGDTGAAESDNVGADVERLSSGSGDDTLIGSGAANRLDGGAGNDFVDGRDRRDVVNAGPGADSVGSRDLARDTVDCGADADKVRGDGRDQLGGDCEVRRVSAPVRVRRSSSRLAGTGAVRLRVTCGLTAFGPCTGRVFVRTARRVRTRFGLRRVRIGSRAFNVDPGQTEAVRVRARPAARRLVRSRRRLVRATAVGGDSAGPASGATTVFVLRR